MSLLPGNKFDRIHSAALAAGLKVVRRQWRGNVEFLQYDGAAGTYAHFAMLNGVFHIESPFDDVIAKWGGTGCDMPIWAVQRIGAFEEP